MLNVKLEEEYLSKSDLLREDFIHNDIEQSSLSAKLQVKLFNYILATFNFHERSQIISKSRRANCSSKYFNKSTFLTSHQNRGNRERLSINLQFNLLFYRSHEAASSANRLRREHFNSKIQIIINFPPN